MRMTLLDRYLFGRFAGALLRTLAALISLYILIDLLTTMRSDILKYDVSWQVVLEYYAASLPRMLYQIAPLSVLVSSLLVLGDAAQNSEVTAALAGGISLRRLVRWPVLGALGVSLLVLGMEETVGAAATRQADRLQTTYFSKIGDIERQGRSWAGLSAGWTCHVLKFNREALTGENVLMHSIRPDAVEQINAHRIFWDPAARAWLLEDGYWQVFKPDYSQKLKAVRITQLPAPFTESPEDLFALEEDPDTKTAAQLLADIRSAERRNIPVASLWADYYAKFSQPALSFVMIGLAIPFALRLRKGGLAISFGLSIAIALAYLVVFGLGMSLGHIGRLAPFLAAWLANFVFLGLGAVLFVRTPT